MPKMKIIDWIVIVLLLVGGLTWGLVGFFNFNLVQTIFGSFAKYVYDLVGIATVVGIIRLFLKK